MTSRVTVYISEQLYPDVTLTCILRWADAVAVTFFVHRACDSGCGQPPVSAESVGGDRGVWAVQGPLAGVAVASSWAGFGCAAGCRVWGWGGHMVFYAGRRKDMTELNEMVIVVTVIVTNSLHLLSVATKMSKTCIPLFRTHRLHLEVFIRHILA